MFWGFVGCFGGLGFFSPSFLGVVQGFWVCFLCLAVGCFFFPIAFLDADVPVESDTDDDGPPRISLAEMLEDLHISQDATGGEGANMMTE